MGYKCVKCENETFTKDVFQATGGTFSKLMDIQNKKFITISCDKCGFTELYKSTTSTGDNILDFLIGN